jgi:hypothetical protein
MDFVTFLHSVIHHPTVGARWPFLSAKTSISSIVFVVVFCQCSSNKINAMAEKVIAQLSVSLIEISMKTPY